MKNVVITGSTRGIGLGLAKEFLRKGCRVVISGRDSGQVSQVVGQLTLKFGPERIHGQACDVTDYQQLQTLWDSSISAFQKIDIWINNAGISLPRLPLHEQTENDLQSIVATNLTGVMLANKLLISEMGRQGHGQIWNMEGFGSNGAVQAGMAAYGATKRAVNYLNKALQKDLADTNVQVCTLSPGIVVTDLLIGDYDVSSEQFQKARKIFNILGDTVETVTPWLVSNILKADRTGAKVAWLTTGKAMRRFLLAGFNKRDLFTHLEQA